MVGFHQKKKVEFLLALPMLDLKSREISDLAKLLLARNTFKWFDQKKEREFPNKRTRKLNPSSKLEEKLLLPWRKA